MSNVQHQTSGTNSSDLGPWTLGPGLRVNDLRKSFTDPAGNRIDVLRGVSFSVEPGESIAIMGPSGTGKSTLLHLLGGLEAPDNGSIALGNFEVDRAQSTALAKFRSHQVGLVFQFHYLLADLSAAENVALPLLIGRTSHATALQQAIALLTEMGLGSRIDHPISHLSGGEQQRVAACRALIKQPVLVLADEPTGNLDATAAARLGELLASYARRRRAIVIIATHNEGLARLCDQILRIDEGRVQPAQS